jgi:hypothetical protein
VRTLAALLLGIVIGVTGLLVVQHPGSLAAMRGAVGTASSSPPVIKQTHQMPAACPEDPQLPCK